MEETANLRRENANLKTAMASQRVLEGQVTAINSTLETLTQDIGTFNRDKEKKLVDHNEELGDIRVKMVEMKR